MRNGIAGRGRDYGLSEVIGFVLIIGIIVILASLYLVYGVPAQGRENEILHMNEVKDEFVTYKVGLDSLFTNNKVGTTISNSFNLGTSGGFSQGTFSFLPVLNPMSSGGTLAINPVGTNQRVTDNETLSISSQSIITSTDAVKVDDLPALVNISPSHIYINFSSFQSTDLDANRYLGVQLNGTNWIALVNLTPRTTFFRNFTYSGSGGSLNYEDKYNYNRSDLTLTVIKNNQITLQELILRSNVTTGTPYSVDLLDPAYGLNNFITYPVYLHLSVYNPLFPTITGNVTYGFKETSYNYTTTLGSIEYQAQNNYWITQKYYYQMGGVFLEQVDGNTTYKLPPEITFAYDNPLNPKILTVSINALSIDPTISSNHGTVAGNSPVQLKTTLTNITAMPFVAGTANTKWITLGVNTTDDKARAMWKNYFDYTAKVANVPQSDYVVGVTGTTSYITLYGYDHSTSATADYDIHVIASNAPYKTTVYGVGGIVQ